MSGRKLYPIAMAAALAAGSAQAFEPRWNPFGGLSQRGVAAPQAEPQRAAGDKPAAADGVETAAIPFEERSLRAVLVNGSASFANVDGKLVRLGEALDDWRLIEVGSHDAVFLRAGQRLALKMQRPQSGATKQAAATTGAPVRGKASPEEAAATAEKPSADSVLDKIKGLIR